ncbi:MULTISPECIES: hypothetical protein [unclassified Methylobacterium]|jgi:hypothetical protein|uniref:hypothetical protein n=1 Tax=unclassified Methylobacterium TaxID=2615210 RepID=UPI00068B718A|nr:MULTISPECIES: hypothetical protein [unclassified Methylobacterium]SFU96578.1 hypothetical protein SAMN02799643_03505 [Methylobacterium sp. UNCCL125]
MSGHHNRERDRLHRRADAFFASKVGGRGEVAEFASALSDLGRTVVIGGMLRDLCVGRLREFRSDVDFVVHPDSLATYDHFVSGLGGKPNRFGGHAIELAHWKVEVWPLQRTWAKVNGHATVDQVEDLLRVTFFDWDAVLYDVGTKRVIADERYFDRVAQRVIDLNLEPNPNPLGNAVRTLRYAYRWGAGIGGRLAGHLYSQVVEYGWTRLVAYEQATFAAPCLGMIDGGLVTARLCGRSSDAAVPVRLLART